MGIELQKRTVLYKSPPAQPLQRGACSAAAPFSLAQISMFSHKVWTLVCNGCILHAALHGSIASTIAGLCWGMVRRGDPGVRQPPIRCCAPLTRRPHEWGWAWAG